VHLLDANLAAVEQAGHHAAALCAEIDSEETGLCHFFLGVISFSVSFLAESALLGEELLQKRARILLQNSAHDDRLMIEADVSRDLK
jgi:hypothetical protein